MSSRLQKRGFSRIKKLLNGRVTRERVLAGIKQLVDDSARRDTILLYFSGHGAQLETGDRSERDGLDEAIVCNTMEAVRDTEINELLDACAPTCHMVAIFDCCHSGSMTDLQPLQRGTGKTRITIGACRDSQLAQQYHGNGVLTTELVRRIDGGEMCPFALHDRQLLGGQRVTITGTLDPAAIGWL